MRKIILTDLKYKILSLGMVGIILVTATVGGALALPIVVYALPPALIRGVTIAEIIITLLSGAGTVPVAPTMTAPIAQYQTTDFDYESLITEGIITSDAPTTQEAINGLGTGQWAYNYNLSDLTTKLGNNWQAMADAGYDSFLALEGAVDGELNGIDVLGRILINVANTGYMGLENTVAIITLPDKVIRAGFDLFAKAFKNVFGKQADQNIPIDSARYINPDVNNQDIITMWRSQGGVFTSVVNSKVRSFDKGLKVIVWYDDSVANRITGRCLLVNPTDQVKGIYPTGYWKVDGNGIAQFDPNASGYFTVNSANYNIYALDWWDTRYTQSGYEGNIYYTSDYDHALQIKDQILNGTASPIVNPNVTNPDGFVNTDNPVNDSPAIGEDQAIRPISWTDYQTYIGNTNNNYENNDYDIQGDTYINYINPYIYEEPEVIPTQPPVVPDQPTIDPKPSIAPEMQEQVLSGTSPNLSTKFPFCIPFDLVNSFKVLEKEAKAPVIEWNFKIDRFDIDEEIVLDLTDFTPVAEILRILILLSYIIGLILLTRSLIGA